MMVSRCSVEADGELTCGAIDQKYLAGRDRNGRGNFRSTSQKNTVRKAYREALAEMEGEDETEE